MSQSEVKITRMNAGQLYDINLNAEERKYFLARHISDQSFKILSIERHGTIIIYANRTDFKK